jgi:hypothetical protein
LADLLLKDAFWGSNESATQPRALVRWRDLELYFADTWRAHPRFTVNYGVRYSYLAPAYQGDDRIGNFILSLYDPSKGSNPLNGLIFPKGLSLPEQGIPGGDANLRGIDVGRALRKASKNLYSPRLGIAWDPTGAGKWAIRAGAGMFFGRADMLAHVGNMINNPPFNASVNWGAGRPLDALVTPLPAGALGTPSVAIAIDGKQQGSYQWNLTIERELRKDTKIEVGYLGNRGHHLPINWNLNYVPSALRAQYARRAFDGDGGTNEHELRLLFPLKGSGDLIHQSNSGNSIYNALQVQLVKRFSEGFSYQVSYSWSKLLALTDLSCCGANQNLRITDPDNQRYDRGLATFDRTHILTMNAIYKLPTLSGQSALIRGVLGGWEGTGIFQYATGVPLTITGGPGAGIFGNRPDLVANTEGPKNGTQWFNPNAYALPVALGALGTSPRGSVRAPGINNLDIALYKNFKLPREGMAIQVRAEFFNVFNHTQFLGVNTSYNVTGLTIDTRTNTFVSCDTLPGNRFPNCNTNASFGKPSRTRDPREVQFGFKFNF